jgi:hypothetical protein
MNKTQQTHPFNGSGGSINDLSSYFRYRSFQCVGISYRLPCYYVSFPRSRHGSGLIEYSVAPSFIAAACYMTFARILWYVTPSDRRNFRSLWLPARWVAPVFVLFDMGAFFIQFLGVVAAASAYTNTSKRDEKAQQTKINNAVRVLKFGLIVQLLCFGVFALIGSRFMFISRGWTVASINPPAGWRRLAWSVNTSATLIMVSTLGRLEIGAC